MYSYSHAATIRWALEQELNRLKSIKTNDIIILEFLETRIKQLKQDEISWHEINSKGLNERSIC